MAANYIIAPEADFSLGIDARSAENQINPGFVKDLLNADIVEKRPRKRPGYQGYAGNVPVRVTSLQYVDATNQIYLTLDSATSLGQTDVDLGSVRSSPIVIYGRTSTATGGPFTPSADAARYYTAFTVPTRKQFLATAGAPPYETISIPQSEHGITSTNLFIQAVESTSTIDSSYETNEVESFVADEATADITLSYQNSTGATIPEFVYYKDLTPVAGSTYVATIAHTGSGSETFTISSGTHGLANYQILAQAQVDNGTTRTVTYPDELYIENDGDVRVTLTAGAATTFYVLLLAAPILNQVTATIPASSTGTVTITGLTSPWVFYSLYAEVTPGGDLQQILPDSVEYDDASTTATLTITNSSTSGLNLSAYYDTGVIRSNQLAVTDASVSADQLDTAPQLTIWGLDHTEIYAPVHNSRAGWSTHIDSYRAPGERRVVTGLGGNLFSARTYSESGTTYLYPKLYPNVRARTAATTMLGPLFWNTGETPERTRGYITADASGTNWATVTAVEYDSGTGWTKYTVSLPNKLILDSTGTPTTLSSVISTISGLEDWLTVQQMGYARHQGTFRIRQVQDGTNQIFVYVENDGITSSDYDDTGCGGEAAVFTDQLTWLATSPFLPSDTLSNSVFADSFILTVLSSDGSTSVVSGLTSGLDVSAGILTVATRTSSVLPLRLAQPSTTASVVNAVRGDMLSYSEINRLVRILYVNPDSNRSVDIAVDGITLVATATLASGSTSFLTVGRTVLLQGAGPYSGSVVVTDIPSLTEFTFTVSSDEGAITGATLLGNTVEIDESLEFGDSIDDSNVVQAEARWIPIEAPDDAYGLTPSTHTRYFDTDSYGEQPFLRSTMVQNNLYLTNYDDEVYKFDGVNNYRAGLLPWQPGLFLVQNTGATAKIVISNRSVAYSAVSSTRGTVTIAAADVLILPVGSSVHLSGTTQTYTVRAIAADADSTTGLAYISFDRVLDAGASATGSVTEVATFRYYFRLNAVDSNNNIVASAVTGYQDHGIELAADASVQIRGVGLPAWDTYDYDRLEVEIYRTKQSLSAPFYRITTLQMDFDNTQGYFQFNDAFADTDLIDLDVVSTALKGTELGINWQEPLRAKYITSIGNSLVLANVRDYPQLDIQMVAPASTLNASFAGKIFTFRRDATDTGTTTSMPDRARYEFVNGTTNTAGTFGFGTANKFTFVATGLPGATAVGDWIYLTYATVATSGRDLTLSGWWQIATVAGTTVTVNYTGVADPGTYPNKYVVATDPTDIPVLLGVDGNLGQVNGDSFDLFDTMRRMSMAIDSTMRMVDISITGMSAFTPWMVTRGGNDVGRAGKLVVRQPRSDSDTLQVLLPSTFTGFDMFVNDVRRAAAASISATTRVYPSRILASYENYPEIFDTPTAILDTESDSAIDVNSADGQEITGVIPFFGDAAFGAAQQVNILVVFKQNSIYLVDLNEKRNGRNAVQRIETEGLGCTAPYSIASTKKGIIFANESGMYCLRRDLAIQYVGKYMERNWTEGVELTQLAIAQGHHYGIGRSYKLSIPVVSGTENSQVYVYNHTGEDEGRLGAWTRYDNHPATGWSNLGEDAYMASSTGRVFSIRRLGDTTDYRDDSSAITFRLQTRDNDYGNSGIRKILDRIIAKYRTAARNLATTVSLSVDCSSEYRETTPVIVPKATTTTGIDDVPTQSIYPVVHTTDRRRGVYFSVEVENDGMDESLEVAGLDYQVAGLNTKGVTQAAQTASK